MMENERTNRRLAAILAADVVGYSRLMAQNEAGTLAALNRHRETEFNPAVARHRGRIVKLIGDGTLVEFTSVVDAVNCAASIQKKARAARGDGPSIVLRIGINLGDIIIDKDDIYGDGVNIAARLEPLAKPGGICVSSIVNESVGDRAEVVFSDGGEVNVKNFDRAVRVWHWHPDQAPSPHGGAQSAPADPEPNTTPENRSIAVLPFENMSGDPEQEYFSDGISEDIITDLSKVSGLLVIARNSSFAYKGKSVDLRKVGRELGVSSILEGSVRRAGNRVRITAQLIDATTGGHLWADRYDRELTDIFAVQDEVTRDIVTALKINLAPDTRYRISNAGTANMEAHDNLLRMRSILHWPGINAVLWKRAVAFGKRAIELDANYTHAYALLAIISMYDFHNRWSGDEPGEVLSRAERLAERAIALDPNDHLANHAVAVIARWAGNYDLAASALEKVLTIIPDYALGLFTRSEIAIAAGRPRDAIADIEHAMRLDPGFTHQYLQNLGMAHLLLGHYETAALVLRERVLLIKDTDIGRAWLASALGHIGEVAEAQQTWADLLKINPDFSIEQRLARQAFADPSYVGKVMDGLTKAGLPT
jgi:adenylate cyclase